MVTSFLVVDIILLFAFSLAFCGANWVARFENSDHGNVSARAGTCWHASLALLAVSSKSYVSYESAYFNLISLMLPA